MVELRIVERALIVFIIGYVVHVGKTATPNKSGVSKKQEVRSRVGATRALIDPSTVRKLHFNGDTVKCQSQLCLPTESVSCKVNRKTGVKCTSKFVPNGHELSHILIKCQKERDKMVKKSCMLYYKLSPTSKMQAVGREADDTSFSNIAIIFVVIAVSVCVALDPTGAKPNRLHAAYGMGQKNRFGVYQGHPHQMGFREGRSYQRGFGKRDLNQMGLLRILGTGALIGDGYSAQDAYKGLPRTQDGKYGREDGGAVFTNTGFGEVVV